ncbi:MarR family transcriptional regulator [uncultured Draconibacterium sp.]|uniref:MarR family winged helix-turn-helix transcriptional regulator n=1 Tax=uncultured Draconibacterium sp. TaxID=1573823 RepID=UPI0032165330
MDTKKPLTHLLGQTSKLIQLKLKESFMENNLDMTVEQYIFLRLIANRDNLIQQELADHFQKDKSLILRQIETLLDRKLVERKTDESDKRKKNLILTEKGKETVALLSSISKKVSNDLLTGITESEQKVFISVIEKIQQNTGHSDLFEDVDTNSNQKTTFK